MIRTLSVLLVLGFGAALSWHAAAVPTPPAAPPPRPAQTLEDRFAAEVRPFFERYCYSCHGPKKQEASLDLSRDTTLAAVARNPKQWELVLQRLRDGEMPPEDTRKQPTAGERAAVVGWLAEFRSREAERHAGDPGVVLARRLSNAEYDYTIRDLTGVDIRPTREFPVDPANEAGFDNSGESLAMSPALLKKYLAAARHVADHVVLKPEGFVFAPHPAVTDTDCDKYCVKRIIDFYQRHEVDLADYFLAAWKYRYRTEPKPGSAGVPPAPLRAGRPRSPEKTLEQFAADMGLSAKYLGLVWAALTEGDATGPLGEVRKAWNELPTENALPGCEKLRDLVTRLRKPLKPKVEKLRVSGISPGSQPLVLWSNTQLAGKHRSYTGDATDKAERAALERFCSVFPDTFVVTDRGPYFDPNGAGKGRPLTAGFHLMQGYFRDDRPLYELILTDAERKELDALWVELDFITRVPVRQYKDFIFFERAEPPRFMFDAEFDFARSEDKDAASDEKMKRLAKAYLAKARKKGASAEAQKGIETYFAEMSAAIRRVEEARFAAEPSHLASLLKFAERAYRRPLTAAERDDLLAFYRKLRKREGLDHEDAIRDVIASVLVSPHFCYRLNQSEPLATRADRAVPLSDHELASRLSYFLWSSMPDDELLARAAAGDLRKPEVLLAQTRRMLRDPKVRGLAVEFAGNWLDFRRFEEHNAVDRDRFPAFTNELRQAMFEEPVRYFTDIARRSRSVLDVLYGSDTFVNEPLAKHYGIPFPNKAGEPGASATGARADQWVHVPDATKYGRGGVLPMAVFLTKNAPGLRTSPVKRGYWVVRRLLGERIPPPPPTVPELPKDEAKLGDLTLPQVLAKHRDNKACAGCHNRFDSVGLVFEGFGPVGERRTKNLGGKPVSAAATFPDGRDRDGIAGLRAYLREKRQDDYLDNLCRKLFSYALGRSLLPSDDKAIAAMRAKLQAHGYALGSLVESIVTSPQFLNKRGPRKQP